MIDVIREAERKSLNVVSLSDLLAGASIRFRHAVHQALIREGFEMDESLPCLQHPIEIAEAIQWLEEFDFGSDWQAFHTALHAASKTGILVDISRKSQRPKHSMRDRTKPRWSSAPRVPGIRIEYRYPGDQWNCFGIASRPGWAQELLEVCRQNHPGSECRIENGEAVTQELSTVH